MIGGIPYIVCAYVCHNIFGAYVCHNIFGAYISHNIFGAYACHNIFGAYVCHNIFGAYVCHKGLQLKLELCSGSLIFGRVIGLELWKFPLNCSLLDFLATCFQFCYIW